jgi:hypothetical protein
MIRFLLLTVAALIPAVACAELQSGPIDYKSQDTVLEGYVAFNKDVQKRRVLY